MLISSCLEEYIIALLTFIAGNSIGKNNLIGISDVRLAGGISYGSGNIIFQFLLYFSVQIIILIVL